MFTTEEKAEAARVSNFLARRMIEEMKIGKALIEELEALRFASEILQRVADGE